MIGPKSNVRLHSGREVGRVVCRSAWCPTRWFVSWPVPGTFRYNITIHDQRDLVEMEG